MAHVTSVHYAISNPFIYTIIFNFFANHGRCQQFMTTILDLLLSKSLSFISIIFRFYIDLKYGKILPKREYEVI